MKTQKGRTLIALIITIIVMLILVGVSVSVALNTGLFKTAPGAAKNTQLEAERETALSNGTVKIGDAVYGSLDAYVKGEAPIKQSAKALKKGDYISYEQKFKNGTESITNWRVIENKSGNITLMGILNVQLMAVDKETGNLPEPYQKYGNDSLLGDVKFVEDIKEFFTILVGTPNTMTTSEPNPPDEENEIYFEYYAFSESEIEILSEFGLGEEGNYVMYANHIDLDPNDGRGFLGCEMFEIRQGNTFWLYDHYTFSIGEEENEIPFLVTTSVSSEAMLTGGAGTSGSPYTLGK